MTSTKEIHRLMKTLDKLTDGQAKINEINWDAGDTSKFILVVCPNSGLYKGGIFEFDISLADDYPNSAPTVSCLTDIYHPNIDTSYGSRHDNVCLNVLENRPFTIGLQALVLALIYLLNNPNLDDPLNPYFDAFGDYDEFARNVSRYMTGDDVEGVKFEKKFYVAAGITVYVTPPINEENSYEAVDKIENGVADCIELNEDAVLVNDNGIIIISIGDEMMLVNEMSRCEMCVRNTVNDVDDIACADVELYISKPEEVGCVDTLVPEDIRNKKDDLSPPNEPVYGFMTGPIPRNRDRNNRFTKYCRKYIGLVVFATERIIQTVQRFLILSEHL
ncbi:ubiquitin-conjugating enzyme E2 R2-like [Dreissena polymorpha]|uniref:UBC core domain-containing protein n=1 Tax=Dreissena polymorpha TaxID=45954 RepID=A0A9D4MFA0_DREPO|nr:ubiquitin-conjugating enzyme E2 R2-like [Dreissena polymorpha]KAH3874151.1 hypothetical protein DPMN_037393 [Dreissena polymorpha]